MVDERAFLERFEAADTETLARLLLRPADDEETLLRDYLGPNLYQRLHSLALTWSGASARRRGAVVVIPSTLGTALNGVDRAGRSAAIWLNVPAIMAGELERLRLSPDGRRDADARQEIVPAGMLKRFYGELLLVLAQRWHVHPFWYDWRKDLDIAAAALEAQLSEWFTADGPLHLVTHAAGCLVARTFIKNYPERWADITRGGGRLIMLGPTNHGTFVLPRLLRGLDPTLHKLARLDTQHETGDLLSLLQTFIGLYHLLPSPLITRGWARLYEAETYGEARVPQAHLDHALAHHKALREVVDPEHMICILGDQRPTLGPISDWKLFRAGTLERVAEMFAVTLAGDGSVSHQLGRLTTPDGQAVPTYFVGESHGNLATATDVLAAVEELLIGGQTERLSREPQGEGTADESTAAVTRLRQLAVEDEGRLTAAIGQLTRGRRNSGELPPLSDAERRAQELLIRGFLSTTRSAEPAEERPAVPIRPARLTISLRLGRIEESDQLGLAANAAPIDALAVGHYVGARPQGPALALDRALSTALPGQRRRAAGLDEAELMLTQCSDRGIIRGELGQPFFVPDPRSVAAGPPRILAVIGMGVPGRFGSPELTILARELCWSLGRLGRRHLATVLIGAGEGNLPADEAIGAWIRGIKLAISGAIEDEQRHLAEITFVEYDPRKLRQINDAIVAERDRLENRNRLRLSYIPLSEEQLAALDEQALEWEISALRQRRQAAPVAPEQLAPTRVIFQREGDDFRIGALTASAAVPERLISIDYDLVMQANDELAAEPRLAQQIARGQFLERLLIPSELRPHFATAAPLVMLLDTTTARIHWEALAQVEAGRGDEGDGRGGDERRAFLGTSRSFTRQLRTTFAPLPAPPPPPQRLLRVLVVADPAADERLPGAEEEGASVADLFEAFNRVYERVTTNRVEVVRLFGPREATRTNVLRELMLRSYDVLHFAGHCRFNAQNPLASGWLFSEGELLTARELTRLDRVPGFVFSNACESGVLVDEPERRSVDLAPNFALSFFARGVTNIVCTAWPVDDLAARLFAQTLYQGLLGVAVTDDGPRPQPLLPMHLAMRAARLGIAEMPNGVRTWGAYQHYGDPYFSFFDRSLMPAPPK